MTRPSDEMLMAYADDALEPEQRALVEAHLATDSETRARVALLRATGALAREAFGRPMREAPPPALVEAILGKPVEALAVDRRPTAPEAASGRAGPPGWHGRAIAPATRQWALAASLAMLAALGAGYLAGRYLDVRADAEIALGEVPKGGALAALLERRPSGSPDGRLVVVASFRDKSNRPCREIEALSRAEPPHPEIAGVACRGAGGTWTVEGAIRLSAPAPAGSAVEPSGVTERDALDGLLGLLGAKTALSPANEADLIARGWK